MNRETFDKGCRLLAATWPDRAPTVDTLAAYWAALHHLHDSVFEAAIVDCLHTYTYFPKPSEILSRAQAALGAAGMLPPAGETAWAEVLSKLPFYSPDNGWCAPACLDDDGGGVHWGEVGRDGYYGAPNPLPELTQQAIRALGGMDRISYATYHELGFIRREFIEFYDHRRGSALIYDASLMTQALPAPKTTPLEIKG